MVRHTCDACVASRGHAVLSLAQLKMLQEAITLTVFVPFALFYLREPLKLNYLWAGLCIAAGGSAVESSLPQRRPGYRRHPRLASSTCQGTG